MAVLRIVTWGDPVLRKVSRAVEPHEFDDAFRAWCQDLTETLYEADGVGLAAVQVNNPIRALVVDTQFPDTGRKEPVVYVNPVIEPAGPCCDIDEGCLSVPGVRGKVSRPERINISWQDTYGATHRRENVEGMEARCLQHEMDHLEGVVFVDRLSPAARSLAAGKLRRLAARAAGK
jgi:peptide deformylase